MALPFSLASLRRHHKLAAAAAPLPVDAPRRGSTSVGTTGRSRRLSSWFLGGGGGGGGASGSGHLGTVSSDDIHDHHKPDLESLASAFAEAHGRPATHDELVNAAAALLLAADDAEDGDMFDWPTIAAPVDEDAGAAAALEAATAEATAAAAAAEAAAAAVATAPAAPTSAAVDVSTAARRPSGTSSSNDSLDSTGSDAPPASASSTGSSRSSGGGRKPRPNLSPLEIKPAPVPVPLTTVTKATPTAAAPAPGTPGGGAGGLQRRASYHDLTVVEAATAAMDRRASARRTVPRRPQDPGTPAAPPTPLDLAEEAVGAIEEAIDAMFASIPQLPPRAINRPSRSKLRAAAHSVIAAKRLATLKAELEQPPSPTLSVLVTGAGEPVVASGTVDGRLDLMMTEGDANTQQMYDFCSTYRYFMSGDDLLTKLFERHRAPDAIKLPHFVVKNMDGELVELPVPPKRSTTEPRLSIGSPPLGMGTVKATSSDSIDAATAAEVAAAAAARTLSAGHRRRTSGGGGGGGGTSTKGARDLVAAALSSASDDAVQLRRPPAASVSAGASSGSLADGHSTVRSLSGDAIGGGNGGGSTLRRDRQSKSFSASASPALGGARMSIADPGEALQNWVAARASMMHEGDQATKVRRLRVLNLLRIWAMRHPEDFAANDGALRKRLAKFVSDEVVPDPDSARYGNSILQVLEQGDPTRPSAVPPRRPLVAQFVDQFTVEWSATTALSAVSSPTSGGGGGGGGAAAGPLSSGSQHQRSTSSDAAAAMPATPATPASPPSATADALSLLQHKPEAVAQQLTLIEKEMFRRVYQSELVMQSWNKADRKQRAPNLLRFISWFNHVSSWVSTEVCAGATVKQRVATIRTLLDVARYCLHYRNYNGVFEIVVGLLASPVARLKKTWKALPSKAQQVRRGGG